MYKIGKKLKFRQEGANKLYHLYYFFMARLSESQIADYFHRCYKSVDGLWFLMVEKEFGFEKALEIDNEVWKVFSKTQIRKIRSFFENKENFEGDIMVVANGTDNLDALIKCLEIKLALEGFQFKVIKSKKTENEVEIVIKQCPWHQILVDSERAHLSERIGRMICNTEYSTWAREFSHDKNSFGSCGNKTKDNRNSETKTKSNYSSLYLQNSNTSGYLVHFESGDRICCGDEICVLKFKKT